MVNSQLTVARARAFKKNPTYRLEVRYVLIRDLTENIYCSNQIAVGHNSELKVYFGKYLVS